MVLRTIATVTKVVGVFVRFSCAASEPIRRYGLRRPTLSVNSSTTNFRQNGKSAHVWVDTE
jgi:hypothetical protein